MALLVVLVLLVLLARLLTLAVGDDRSTALVLITVFAAPKVPAPENKIGKIRSLIQNL